MVIFPFSKGPDPTILTYSKEARVDLHEKRLKGFSYITAREQKQFQISR